jgi:NAD(P) transhydrogenase subunit beta
MTSGLVSAAYLIAGILFTLSISGLSKQESSKRGNFYGMLGMLIAIIAVFLQIQTSSDSPNLNIGFIAPLIICGSVIGLYFASSVAMTGMPSMVAIFNSLVGASATLVSFSSFFHNYQGTFGENDIIHKIEILLGIFIGSVTFSGSIIAFGKLRGSISGEPLLLPGRHLLNLALLIAIAFLGFIFLSNGFDEVQVLVFFTGLSLVIGIFLVLAIGGADMPVVVSLLNCYSGWASAAAGFMLKNDLLIITGALVGSSGAILTYIMCKAMNRKLSNVVFGGFGTSSGSSPSGGGEVEGTITETTADEVAEELKEAKEVMIVPGYGMAVAQAQHVVKDITETLRAKEVNVRFAIHPVAGRLPGHMNVLLAEANVPYDIVFEMDEINDDLPEVDLLLVVGANDIVNPSALEDSSSPIAGMPVIEAWKAKSVVALKRSMAAGYSGVENPLYFKDNTDMLFGDAKDTLSAVFAKLG